MGWLTGVLDWAQGLPPGLAMWVITFIPALELRASIPFGIFVSKCSWPYVVFQCTVANILVGILYFVFLDKFVHLFLRWKRFARAYEYYAASTQRRIHSSVERWGWLGLAVFIGVPLPGTGAYSGALAGYLVGMSYKKFLIANALGVIMAAAAVTAACLSAWGAGWLYSNVS